MTATFENHGPPVSGEQVDAFERTLPAALPADYRQFLLEQNGGTTALLWWPPEAGGFEFDVAHLHSLGDVEMYQSLSVVRKAFSDTLPSVFLIVGSDQGGAKVCLSLQAEDHGAVWFYDPDLEFDPSEPADPDLLRPVCASFTVLLETLEPEPDFDEAERRIAAARAG